MTTLLDAGTNTATWYQNGTEGLSQADFEALPDGRLKSFLTRPYTGGTQQEAYAAMSSAVASDGVFIVVTPIPEYPLDDSVSCLGTFSLSTGRKIAIEFAGFATPRIVKVTMTYSADA